jgi:DNA replication protein DnaC
VKVVVRCRPLSSQEVKAGNFNVVNVDESRGMISVKNPTREFTFDRTYSQTSKQETIFEHSSQSIVESVLEGYNGTIFAYGQTGTGKTFTMEGC